jgi:hypothetical protein
METGSPIGSKPLRKLFILSALLGLMIDLVGASEALAKKHHKRQPPPAAASSSTPAPSQPSHPGGGSNSK